jgi:hypothetical protein
VKKLLFVVFLMGSISCAATQNRVKPAMFSCEKIDTKITVAPGAEMPFYDVPIYEFEKLCSEATERKFPCVKHLHFLADGMVDIECVSAGQLN